MTDSSSVAPDMSPVKTSRRDRAAQTRAAIIAAAEAEFLVRGFHGATVTAIAQRAGVAPQTVYFVFHTKSELISAVIDAAVMGDDELPPDMTGWWRAMQAEPDAVESVRIFVRGAIPIFERAAGVAVVLAAAALTDDEIRVRQRQHDHLQRVAFREVVVGLEAKSALRAGLDTDSATDVLLTVFSDASYHSLRTDRGWSEQRVAEWLSEALPLLLLAPSEQPRQVSR